MLTTADDVRILHPNGTFTNLTATLTIIDNTTNLVFETANNGFVELERFNSTHVLARDVTYIYNIPQVTEVLDFLGEGASVNINGSYYELDDPSISATAIDISNEGRNLTVNITTATGYANVSLYQVEPGEWQVVHDKPHFNVYTDGASSISIGNESYVLEPASAVGRRLRSLQTSNVLVLHKSHNYNTFVTSAGHIQFSSRNSSGAVVFNSVSAQTVYPASLVDLGGNVAMIKQADGSYITLIQANNTITTSSYIQHGTYFIDNNVVLQMESETVRSTYTIYNLVNSSSNIPTT